MRHRIYEYKWGNNPKRLEMKGRRCVLLKSLKMSSVIIQFTDNGQIEVTSSRALKRIKDATANLETAQK